MAQVSQNLKDELGKLSHADLLKIILRFAKKYREMNEILELEFVNSTSEEELMEDVGTEISGEFGYFRERIIQKELTKAISNSIGYINDFKKIVKNPYLEAKLLEQLLNIIKVKYEKELGTCWSAFDSKVATTLKRLMNLVLKLHNDYHIEFQDSINNSIKMLKTHSRHLDQVYSMPQNFEDFKIQGTNSEV